MAGESSGMTDDVRVRKRLGYVLHVALGRIRHLCQEGQAEQAAVLAAAIDDLPRNIVNPSTFDEAALLERLQHYQTVYSRVSIDIVGIYKSDHVPENFV